VFAGAARAAVFGRPEVVRHVNSHFVPVALKAGLVNNPPRGAEGQLYREIARSKIAPQGICVVNSSGKVLDWVLMFDDDRSVLAFLDHARKRFANFPDAKHPVAAQRHMKFPSARLDDEPDNGKAPPLIERHPGTSCPATPLRPRGTVVVRAFGRALGKDGKPLADTLRQEHYVEDHFEVPVAAQEALAKALAAAGDRRFRMADGLARLLVSHAYLGQLDVNPVDAPGGTGKLTRCELWMQKLPAKGRGPTWLRVAGRSEAAGASRDGQGGDGRLWSHEVKLDWEGLLDVQGERITRLLLIARGAEKLRWGNKAAGVFEHQVDVARLPGGHAIDLSCDVRHGFIGAPVPAEQATDTPDRAAEAILDVPEEARRQLAGVFGPTFLIFRAKVQQELKLSAGQKRKVERRLLATVQDAGAFFQKLDEAEPQEREEKLGPYRRQAQRLLAAFLEGVLEDAQRDRLRQLALQQQGLFALGEPDVARELKITDRQREQFMGLVQAMERQLRPLARQAQAGGAAAVGPKMMKIRKEHEDKVAALLSAGQRKRWQEMLGKAFALGE
jgi:hypothetical protein